MAAAVLAPIASLSLNDNSGVLPPSAVAQHAPRHGRSRGASIRGKGRGYSIVEDADTTLYKALMFVLKRSIQEDDLEEDAEEDKEVLVADAEGWVDVDDVLAHPRITALETTLSDIQRVVGSKTRLYLRPADSSFEIRFVSNRDSTIQSPTAPTAATAHPTISPSDPLETLTPELADLPDFLVYETTYQGYPLILASGSIRRAAGAPFLHFAAVSVDEDGNMPAIDAEVGIWVSLKEAMAASPAVVWKRAEGGQIVTAEELPTALWNKAVARRADIGVLFEDGEVRKEIPAGLRGKGAKGKTKKGKGSLKKDSKEAGDDSGSASEE